MGKNYKIHETANGINVEFQANVKVNSRELENLKRREIPELFAPDIAYKKGRTILIYDTSGYASLNSYLKKGIKKKEFLDVIYSFLKISTELKKKFMQIVNLILDKDKIFVNEVNGNIKYIYIPLIYSDRSDETIEYLKNLPFWCVFSNAESHEYVKQYISYFNNMINFSMYDYSALLKKLSGGNTDSTSDKCFLIKSDTNQHIRLNKKVSTIGKNEISDIVVNGNHVSRNHAQIIFHNGIHYLQDCNSTNHTYLNGKMIQPGVKIKLENKDVITFADVSYIYVTGYKGGECDEF